MDMKGTTMGSTYEGLNLLSYLRVLKKRRVMIVVIVALVTVTGVIISLVLPKTYRADATIIPMGGGGSGFSALAARAMGLNDFGVGKPQKQIMAVLNSRTLAERVITKHNLMPVLFGREGKTEADVSPLMMERAAINLRSHVSIADSIKGIIRISASFREPQVAADVANGYIEELQALLNESAFTTAKRNRIFIEGQLAQNKRDLLLAGKELNEFYKGGKVSNIESMIDVPLDDGNMGITDAVTYGGKNLLGTLEALQDKKNRIDSIIGGVSGEGKAVVKDVPQQIYLQYLALRRNLLGKINTLLSEQYEIAKIEEARVGLTFEIVDRARVPVSRDSPNRKNIVMMFFMISILLALFSAFLAEYYYTRLKSPA